MQAAHIYTLANMMSRFFVRYNPQHTHIKIKNCFFSLSAFPVLFFSEVSWANSGSLLAKASWIF
jgi:hypothetical protein